MNITDHTHTPLASAVGSSSQADGAGTHATRTTRPAPRAFGVAQLAQALPGAVRRLNPAQLWRNPVMFLVWAGAALTTAIAVAEPFLGGPEPSGGSPVPAGFTWGIAIWLWLTVLFANLAESVAEGRGRAQAQALRQTRTSTLAHRVRGDHAETDAEASAAGTDDVASSELTLGDVVISRRAS